MEDFNEFVKALNIPLRDKDVLQNVELSLFPPDCWKDMLPKNERTFIRLNEWKEGWFIAGYKSWVLNGKPLKTFIVEIYDEY